MNGGIADRSRAIVMSIVALWCAFAPPIDTATPSAAGPIFVESSVATGLTFTHVNGATGDYYIAEEMGAGVALIDYDNDGDLDVFFVQGGTLVPRLAGSRNAGQGSRLFRNDLVAGKNGGSQAIWDLKFRVDI
jgi:hypothetical protein